MPKRDILASLINSKHPQHTHVCKILKKYPSLRSEPNQSKIVSGMFVPSSWIKSAVNRKWSLLLSIGEQQTEYHVDDGCAKTYIYMLSGIKTIYLWRPEAGALTKWPNLNSAFMKIQACENDLVIIPPGWWHTVVTESNGSHCLTSSVCVEESRNALEICKYEMIFLWGQEYYSYCKSMHDKIYPRTD